MQAKCNIFFGKIMGFLAILRFFQGIIGPFLYIFAINGDCLINEAFFEKISDFFGVNATCLFTRLDRVYPGPSSVSDSPVSAGNVIYEDFVVMGELW